MKSRRSIIRAILFVVRLQKSVATHHTFPPNSQKKHRTHSGKRKKSPAINENNRNRRISPSCPPFSSSSNSSSTHFFRQNSYKLKRCESTRNRHRQTPAQKLFARHRNSAPTTIFFRTPTPHIEIIEPETITFASYINMVQPYALRLERAAAGSKPQLTIHPTMAHHLASKILLHKQPSLDDRRTTLSESLASGSISDGGVTKFVRRQGSVESAEKRRPPPLNQVEQNLKRKVKSAMISVYGALTAIEQDDLDSLRMILSKNSVPVNDSLNENAFYSQFPCKVTLLDVALMFNRLNAASLLLQHEATENLQLSDINKRKQIVDEVLLDYETRFRQMKMKSLSNKEEEKRFRTMEHHLNSLKKMKSVLDKPEMPGSPVDVKVYVSGTTRATIEFNAPGTSSNCVVTKYKVEWSKTSSFEEIEGSQIIYDMRGTSITISNLEHGVCYTFRIYAGSMWGFGEPIVALPKNLRISSWEDCDNVHPERVVSMRAMAELHLQVEKYRQSAVWQVVFPNNGDGAIKKKKTGLRNLFSASSKFIKNVGRGLYFASLIYTEDKVLCTVDDCLPVIQIDDSIISVPMDDMEWLMKLSLCWDQVNYLQDSSGGTWSSNLPFRAKVLEAVAAMHNALGVKDIGRIHHIPLTYSAATTFIVSVHFVTENQATQSQGLAMRWMKLNKIMRKKSSSTPLDFLCREMFPVLNFFEASQIPLDRGLYLGYLKMQSSLNTIRVTVPDNMPSALPYVTVRSTPHVSQEEWEWVRSLDSDDNTFSRPTPTQHNFHQQLMRATEVLLKDLDLDADLIRHHRLFKFQVLQLHPDVSFILIFPRAEDVCQVHASYTAIDEYNDSCKRCASIPIPVFEMISFSTYQPDFIATYCRMNIFIEHFITIIRYEIRQCLHEKDARVYNEQLEKLAEFQAKLDEIWRSSRWISNIATIARERQSNCGISLSHILNPPPPAFPSDNASDVGYHSDLGNKNVEAENVNGNENVKADVNDNTTEDATPAAAIRRANFRNSKTNNNESSSSSHEPLSRSKSVVERGEVRLASIDKMFQEDNLYTLSEFAGKAEAAKKLQCDSTTLDYLAKKLQQNPPPPRLSGIIRVFAAYDCALPKNTAIRLSITQATTAREVVALFVEQINKLTLLSDDNDNKLQQLQDFCLVSVVGARERRLRDEFQPMRLLPPFSRGRLFVRRCDSATAAIRFGNETFV